MTTDKLVNGAVTTAKLNDAAVTTDKLADGAVTATKINNSAVTTDKILNDAVTEDKIATGAVTRDKIADDAITELTGMYDTFEQQIAALSSGMKVGLSISPSVIYKGESQNITLTGTMTNGTPTSMKLLDGATELATSAASPITHTMGVTQSTNSKSYSLQGVTLGMALNAQASVNARYPIYYGFGADASAVAVAANKYVPTTSALHTYNKTASTDGQHFYILVPTDIASPSDFTMGGAPFVMTSSSETIGGVSYTVYESGNAYNSGTELSVTAQ